MNNLFKVALALVLVTPLAHADTYIIDPYHSSVSFTVKHVVGKVIGHFNKFSGSFEYVEGKPSAWSTQATIESTSVDTGIEKRDNHLRTPDYLNVAQFPSITFKSTAVTDVQGNKAKLHGDFTLHGVTKPVVLDLEIAGVAADPMGKGTRAGASATGHIKRSDYGVGATTGPMAGMVGDDLLISIEIEGTKK